MRKPDVQPTADLLEQMGYEPRDIALSTILRWISFLFVFIFGTLVVSIGIYRFFVPTETQIGRSSPLLFQRSYPPNPQVQPYPKRDMMVWREAEDALIAGKAADPLTGRPVLPIDQAVDILATQRGIAGIRGNAVSERPDGYPGSGLYEVGATRANSTGPNDTTSPGISNKGTQSGAPGAGGTFRTQDPNVSDRLESPGGSITNAGQGAQPNAGAPGPEATLPQNPGAVRGGALEPGTAPPGPAGGAGEGGAPR